MRRVTIAVVVAVRAFSPSPAVSRRSPASASAAPAHPDVLIVGVYHMTGSGNHVVDAEADDVRTRRRQAEIAEVMEVLERFRPTEIAVEAPFYDGDVIARRHTRCLNGERDLSRNARQQIGFRLAEQIGRTLCGYPQLAGEARYAARQSAHVVRRLLLGERLPPLMGNLDLEELLPPSE